jgi:hypothetical protein
MLMDLASISSTKRKTPADVSEFEREQLRFFLASDDLAAVLAALNPSLAWLPLLSQMKLIQSEIQLIAWIERNLENADAVREVVANLELFGPDTANFLQYRLNSPTAHLSPLLAKCWNLIVRHMRTNKRGLASNELFDLLQKLKRGEHSNDILERLANALRPRLRIKKRFTLHGTEDKAPQTPSDLMSIDFEVDRTFPLADILAVWPEDASAASDETLLFHLTTALEAALGDATDVGVESNMGYSTSDIDVPSVASHSQNDYRSGFQQIVRTIAEVWTRLAKKSPDLALSFTERWRRSDFRLMRRVALFAAADPALPSAAAANMLMEIPQGELFFTNSSVEVLRLIRARWNDFSIEDQQNIVRRLCEGPPRNWFLEGAEIDRIVDRTRFDVFSHMIADGLAIGDEATKLLSEIKARWPQWVPTPAEQAGFHIWHSSGPVELPSTDIFAGVPDNKLVGTALEHAAKADFLDANRWDALCLSKPDRALRGLEAVAAAGSWPAELWRQMIWSRTPYVNPETEARMAELLLQCPSATFATLADAASAWLNEHSRTLAENLLWQLWDKIAAAALNESQEEGDE